MGNHFVSKAAKVMGLTLSLFASLPVHAHGWVVSPASRQQFCAVGQGPFDCGDVKYEPQSVEGPKGSRLCSGGSRFGVLDANADWPTTNVGRDVNITWNLTAPHRTATWDYFVDGQFFTSVNEGNQIPGNHVTHTIRNLPSGRHTVLAVWNIADTPMAFYNCIDLDID